MHPTLDVLRARPARPIGWVLVIHVPLVLAVGLLRGQAVLWLAVAAPATLVQISAVRRIEAVSGQIVMAFAYAAIIGIVVARMTDHPWKIDIHMHVFAAQAAVAALCRWPAILGFVGFVAGHHVLPNFVLSDCVFGGRPDLPRVALHARYFGVGRCGIRDVNLHSGKDVCAQRRFDDCPDSSAWTWDAFARSHRRAD